MARVRLRPMTGGEFSAYLSWVVDDYAEELARNGRATREEAPAQSKASFDALLPDGLDTPGQVVLVAEDPEDGRRVGHLWFGPSSDDAQRAWVYDITVEEPERRRGYGRAMMEAFEDEARARGFVLVGLNVFGDNVGARTLYESLGYREIARQMAKDLEPGQD